MSRSGDRIDLPYSTHILLPNLPPRPLAEGLPAVLSWDFTHELGPAWFFMTAGWLGIAVVNVR